MTPNERQQQIGAAYIPAHIMCDMSLTLTQKVLWGRIQGLSTKLGYCYASNEWIGEQIGIKKGTVSNVVSQLVKSGHLLRKVIRNEAGEITERWLYPVSRVPGGVSTQELIPLSTEELTPPNAGIDPPVHAGMEGSVRKGSVREESKDVVAHQIIARLNELRESSWTWVRYTPLAASTTNVEQINGRLKEYAEADLVLVLEYLAVKDGGDEKSRGYYDCVTPFRVKNFERRLVMAREWEARGRPSKNGEPERTNRGEDQRSDGHDLAQYEKLVKGGMG